jgi:hypothetical protein
LNDPAGNASKKKKKKKKRKENTEQAAIRCHEYGWCPRNRVFETALLGCLVAGEYQKLVNEFATNALVARNCLFQRLVQGIISFDKKKKKKKKKNKHPNGLGKTDRRCKPENCEVPSAFPFHCSFLFSMTSPTF